LTARRTIAYWVLFAVLVGYYWIIEHRAAPPSEIRQAREKVLDVFSDDVVALTLRREGNEIRCERRDKLWQIVKPADAKVPVEQCTALIEHLLDM